MIKYGDNSTKIMALPASDFPFVKKDKGEDYTEVKASDLKNISIRLYLVARPTKADLF